MPMLVMNWLNRRRRRSDQSLRGIWMRDEKARVRMKIVSLRQCLDGRSVVSADQSEEQAGRLFSSI